MILNVKKTHLSVVEARKDFNQNKWHNSRKIAKSR